MPPDAAQDQQDAAQADTEGQDHLVIVGGGIVGVSLAYFLTHPTTASSALARPPSSSSSDRNDDDPHSGPAAGPRPPRKITLLEGTRLAAGASGYAGGFLACSREWFGPETQGLADLGFELHAKLAQEHGGEGQWGYRRVRTWGVPMDRVGGAAGGGGGAGEGEMDKEEAPVPWLKGATAFEPKGDEASTAQCLPGDLTRLLAARAEERGVEVVYGEAVGLVYHNEDDSPAGSASSGNETGRQVSGVRYIPAPASASAPASAPTSLPSPSDPAPTPALLPCSAVVLAPGPWLGALAARLFSSDSDADADADADTNAGIARSLDVYGTQANSIVLRPSATAAQAAHFRAGAHAVFARIEMGGPPEENEPEVYCRPDGTVYLCGTAGPDPLPPTAHAIPSSPAALRKLHAEAAALHPMFDPSAGCAVLYAGACYLPKSRRGWPLVGAVRGVRGVWAGGGLGEWGVLQGPAVGWGLGRMVCGLEVAEGWEGLRP